MADSSINEFMSRMTEAFIPEKAAGMDATIQFKLTGAQAVEGYMTIKDGNCTLSQGTAPAPKLTVTADSDDLTKIFTGQLDGMQAYMQGKFKLAGDMSVAMKMLGLFKMK